MRSTGFRRTFAALGVCSLALAASACGSGDGDSASGKTRITVNCEPPKSAKVDRGFFEQDVAAFEKQNPDIDVVAHDAFPCQDPKTFDAELAGGQMEDVFYTYFTDARHVVDIRQAADLTPSIKELKSYDTIQKQLREIPGCTVIVCEHWALSELLAAPCNAFVPLCTGEDTTLPRFPVQVHGARLPVSKSPFVIAFKPEADATPASANTATAPAVTKLKRRKTRIQSAFL